MPDLRHGIESQRLQARQSASVIGTRPVPRCRTRSHVFDRPPRGGERCIDARQRIDLLATANAARIPADRPASPSCPPRAGYGLRGARALRGRAGRSLVGTLGDIVRESKRSSPKAAG